jgi:hypothetical protein
VDAHLRVAGILCTFDTLITTLTTNFYTATTVPGMSFKLPHSFSFVNFYFYFISWNRSHKFPERKHTVHCHVHWYLYIDNLAIPPPPFFKIYYFIKCIF